MASDEPRPSIWPTIIVSGIGAVITVMAAMLTATWSLQDRFISIRDHDALIAEVRRNEVTIGNLERDKADKDDLRRQEMATVQQHVSSLQREEFERFLKQYKTDNAIQAQSQRDVIAKLQQEIDELSTRERQLSDRVFGALREDGPKK